MNVRTCAKTGVISQSGRGPLRRGTSNIKPTLDVYPVDEPAPISEPPPSDTREDLTDCTLNPNPNRNPLFAANPSERLWARSNGESLPVKLPKGSILLTTPYPKRTRVYATAALTLSGFALSPNVKIGYLPKPNAKYCMFMSSAWFGSHPS